MEKVRVFACESVLRACCFALLAIFCLMVGLSGFPRAAFQVGGFLSMAMTLVLVEKAHRAKSRDYRRTEVWLLLPREYRPPPAEAQDIVSSILQETYLTFARWTALVCAAMWILALLFQ